MCRALMCCDLQNSLHIWVVPFGLHAVHGPCESGLRHMQDYATMALRSGSVVNAMCTISTDPRQRLWRVPSVPTFRTTLIPRRMPSGAMES
jgi:hypothetical protein